MPSAPAVHLFVPDLNPGDAVGGHTVHIRRLLHDLGHESEVFVETAAPRYADHTRPFADYTRVARPGDVLLYQMAIGSVMADFLLDRRETLVVNYHNLTPAGFFEPWEPQLVHGMHWGRRQLADLTARTRLGVCDSAYNEAELVALGYRETAVVPILFDAGGFDRAVDEALSGRLTGAKAGGGADWLFVGRIAPNKCQHDVVKAFAAYRRVFDPAARLHLVGGASSHAYLSALEGLVAALGLGGAVTLAGSVSEGELSAYYRAADVFVCLSEHEGFCVPLLEAMHHRVPVVALAAAAVPETLGGAGLVLDDKSPVSVAAAVHRVVSDRVVGEALVEAGSARLADFDLSRTRARLTDVLAPVLASA